MLSTIKSISRTIVICVPARFDSFRRLTDTAYYVCGSGASEGVVSVNGVVGGMDCMPLRPGPFHYLISEQAKSLVALQELQNEVGALLEFRDLVIETFPNLRHKMAVTAAASAATGASSASNGNASSVLITSAQGSHIPLPLSSQSSPSSRRIGEWEPGKVRRRVAQSRENESASSSLPRSRSNSHSGGNKHSATVQDSGFSTETSSKDSASTAIPRPQSPSSRPTVLDEAEDELWNLLDVIHRKGVRLREEVESLQACRQSPCSRASANYATGRLESVAPEELDVPSDILDAVRKVTSRRRSSHLNDDGLVDDDDDEDEEDLLQLSDEGSQLALLQREKLQLLDKVAELEAETISSRARAQELQSELAALSALKNGLEDRLRAGLEAGDATAAGILAPGAHRIQPIEPSAPTLLQSPRANGTALNIRSKDSAFASVVSGDAASKAHKNRFRTRTIEKNVLANVSAVTAAAATVSRSIEDIHGAAAAEASVNERRAKLGALDSVLISPTRLPLHQQQVKRSDVDTRKIAAILRERSPLELQRHLITTTVHNQVLQKRLDEVEKSTETLSERLGKAHEENEDLRFQLAERNIELEGTLARMRLLELLQKRPATETDADDESESPLANGHSNHLHQNGLDVSTNGGGSSSADSSQMNHTNGSTEPQQQHQLKPSPRRRPSRIPLLGVNKVTAPKPPSAATTPTSTTAGSVAGHRRNDSRDSLKSLNARSNNPSISSNGRLAPITSAKSQGRDSSRESLNKSSLSKPREPTSRSLPRNNSGRDSLGKSAINGSLLSRPRDSLESTHSGQQQQAPGTPPRRPPAPARRSQSQAARPSSGGPSDSAADGSGKSMQSSNPPSSWFSSEVSLYPDSLNSTGNTNHNFNEDEDDDETSSRTGSTRVEFIIGSPTRKRLFQTPWSVPRYFDSIDTEHMMMHESYEYPPDHGEALAECDSLECDERLESNS
ncbi:uncharacterized protein LOC100119980 isoform X3 [Nasonia vitripennis]|uniref:Uncharacterized protein n=1 Tax=Nasonia vitripennis TaxID=7425 RepID=A0A7M7QDC1_NASVI|nr:uncharacterized protein LOC100119980 isoform X3 [Nasonia vitripennis]